MKTEDKKNAVTSFSAVVEFADDNTDKTYDVEVEKSIDDMTYDDVIDAVCKAVDNEYGFTDDDFEDEDPYKIIDIVVNDGDQSYPVVDENTDVDSLDFGDVHKVLVLPWARYALTPECKLWMKLKENGMLAEDDEFNYDEMHKIVEALDVKR